jgi:hypothetical protein
MAAFYKTGHFSHSRMKTMPRENLPKKTGLFFNPVEGPLNK